MELKIMITLVNALMLGISFYLMYQLKRKRPETYIKVKIVPKIGDPYFVLFIQRGERTLLEEVEGRTADLNKRNMIEKIIPEEIKMET